MTLLPDPAPFRQSRDFRFLWASGFITYLGSMMTFVALPFQVKELTGSFVAVGALGLIQMVPLVVCGLWGGALADRLDRRAMVLITEAGAGLCVTLLLINTACAHPQVWLVYCAAFFFTVFTSLQRPSLEGLLPRIVGHDQLASASAWMSMRWSITAIAGPALGGVIIAAAGVQGVYVADIATFGLSIAALWRLRPSPTTPSESMSSLTAIRAGARYAASRPDLLGTYVVDIIAMVFAYSNAIFPFMAQSFREPYALGLLYSADAVGALLVSATSGWVARVHRHGRAVALAAIAWGAAVAGMGLTHNLWITLTLLGVAGAADMVSGMFRQLMWNQTIPDAYRGRLAGIEMISYSFGPKAGQMRVSLFADWFGISRALTSGGILCIAGTSIAASTLRRFWSYDSRTDEHAVREREARQNAAADQGPQH
ncbi:MAG: MFS transporter [Actinomycetales bacterium]|nr:MFS transporter [Actinomycetales bacterium]